MPSCVWPSAGSSSISTSPISRRPGAGSACSAQRAWASSAGSASSSSWKTGESTTKHSSPRWTIVQVVCHITLRATMTSSWTPTACISSVGPLHAEQLARLGQRLHLGRRLLLPAVELLLRAVDPDHRDLLLQARLDVVVVAGGHVDPALLRADAPRALGEVRRVGLVGAHLLGGDDEVEVVRDVTPRLAEQLVVDVRDEPGLEGVPELLQLCVGLFERRPALHRVGQEA